MTPLIGADGTVQLEIEQKVEDVTGEVTVGGNAQPIVGTRETTSFVSAKSGDILVLGGLQKTSKSKTRGRLGPIPIIGDLLGPRGRKETKQDLLFFLRPVVLTNTPADNIEALSRVSRMPHGQEVRHALDPNYPVEKKKETLSDFVPEFP